MAENLNDRESAMAYMAAQGRTAIQIADMFGLTSAHVAEILNTERIQFHIRRIQHQIFGKDIHKRFHALLPEAIDATADVLKNPNSKPAVKLSAAQTIMDRALGKPKQTVEHEGGILKALFEKLDKKDPDNPNNAPIDVTPAEVTVAVLENPNGKVKPDVSKNPNLTPADPIDDWASKL